MKGYVQVYTGTGKGKTTASFGLALRAAGAGLNVRIIQFLKSGDYSEIKALKRFDDLISVDQYGGGTWVRGKPSEQERSLAREGFEELCRCVQGGSFDVVIAEELNLAVKFGLVELDEVIELVKSKPEDVELVITGRDARPEILDLADLVTEMRAVKHYFNAGVKARVGIEK